MKFEVADMVEFIDYVPRLRAGRIRDDIDIPFEMRIGPRPTLKKKTIGIIMKTYSVDDFWVEKAEDRWKINVYLVWFMNKNIETFIYEDEIRKVKL